MVCEKYISLPVGTVKTENNAIYVACGNNTVLSLDEIQLEGSKRMTAEDFLRGRSFEPGFSFVTEE